MFYVYFSTYLHKNYITNAIKYSTKINGEKSVSVSASGRTDAGVHALSQKAHFDMEVKISPVNLKKALNSLIPDSIYIKGVMEVEENFHARFDVKAKEYIYIINMGGYNPIEKDYIYQYNKKLDIPEMERALKYIEGTHDFRSFIKVDEEKDKCAKRTKCNTTSCCSFYRI